MGLTVAAVEAGVLPLGLVREVGLEAVELLGELGHERHGGGFADDVSLDGGSWGIYVQVSGESREARWGGAGWERPFLLASRGTGHKGSLLPV